MLNKSVFDLIVPTIVCCGLAGLAAILRKQLQKKVIAVSFRLLPGEDLAEGIEHLVRENKYRAVSILSCVGSVTSATLRLAKPKDANSGKERVVKREECFEIVSVTGTVEYDPATEKVTRHLHIALADENGSVWGGHILSANSDGYANGNKTLPVQTTAEICVLVQNDVKFSREHCKLSGWPELVVSNMS